MLTSLLFALAPQGSPYGGNLVVQDPQQRDPRVFVSYAPDSGPYDGVKYYYLSNDGTKPLQWDASADEDWISFSPSSGVIGIGARKKVTVTIDATEAASLNVGTATATMTFDNNTGTGDTDVEAELIIQTDPSTLNYVSGTWSGATSEPSSYGTGDYADDHAIARWNVVPGQAIDDDFMVGVVAFHAEGIEDVEIAVEGSAWLSPSSMTYNPRSNTHEYTVILDHDDWTTNQTVELRAIAYPDSNGQPRLLESLELYVRPQGHTAAEVWVDSVNGSDSNSGTSGSPFKTLWKASQSFGSNASGDFINCKAGNYTLGKNGGTGNPGEANDTYLTIRPAVGVDRDDVVIDATDNSGLDVKYLKLEGVRVENTINGRSSEDQWAWFDGCYFTTGDVDTEPTENNNTWHRNLFGYFTDCEWEVTSDGPRGARIARDCSIETISRDAYTHVALLVNSEVSDYEDAADEEWHPDVYQFAGGGSQFENMIVYGLKAWGGEAQGFFVGGDPASVEDIAVINSTFAVGISGKIESDCTHLVMMGCTYESSSLVLRDDGQSATDWMIKGNFFWAFKDEQNSPDVDGDWFVDNHYELTGPGGDVVTPGTGVTTGAGQWEIEEDGLYYPDSASDLLDKVTGDFVTTTLDGRPRVTDPSAGANEEW